MFYNGTEVEIVEKSRVRVKILGEDFTVKGTLSPAYIEKIADYVDKKMQSIAEQNPKLSQQKVSILACLNLADEVFRLQDEMSESETSINKKSTS